MIYLIHIVYIYVFPFYIRINSLNSIQSLRARYNIVTKCSFLKLIGNEAREVFWHFTNAWNMQGRPK